MLRFWQNPEFIRHRRSELRRTRALAIVVLVAVICLLVGLACWIREEARLEEMHHLSRQWDGRWNQVLADAELRKVSEFWRKFYQTLVYIQAGIVTFWSLLSCAQSISREREHKTWDFQRITRMTATEMLIGKLLGEPVLAYFIALCCFPITLVVGLLARTSPLHILGAYGLIVCSPLFVGLAGIWLSSLLESRSRGIGIIGSLGLYILIAISFVFNDSSFPGLGAFSPLMALFSLFGYGMNQPVARVFGAATPWPLMSLLLYSAFGVWLVVMITDNIKRDYDEVRPLSRWQAVGFAAFLNFVPCLLYYPRPDRVYVSDPGTNLRLAQRILSAQSFVTTMITMNAVVLFAVGLATLTPQEHLKTWWRKRLEKQATLLSEDGLPWPWLVISAVAAYAVLALGLFVWRHELQFEAGIFWSAAVQSLIVCVFVTRDVLFVQWCRLTRLRSPVIKGCLYLCLYYGASVIVAEVFGINSDARVQEVLAVLTPASIFSRSAYGDLLSGGVIFGLVLQLIAIVVLRRSIAARLEPALTLNHAAAD
jgi:hypothetical protein